MLQFNYTNKDYLLKMKNTNTLLGIRDDSSKEKKDVVFIYSPPKVGSTTLVSSIRLNAAGKFDVMHLHNEIMLKALYNIHDVTILEIIYYNKFLGKNVYVIDIYRSPIEQKMSCFFENIDTFHFNTSTEILKTYELERISKRFNQVFPHITTNDHYRSKYNITVPDKFDMKNKYLLVQNDGINYIKIRLHDSSEWQTILKKIFGFDIYIVNDYETTQKPIGELFLKFKQTYTIPINLFQMIENDPGLHYYYSVEEREKYLQEWSKKMNSIIAPTFSLQDYAVYSSISQENKYMSEIQMDHYIDTGCLCLGCSRKRGILLLKLMKGEKINEKINHTESSKDYLKAKVKKMPIYIQQKVNPNIVKKNFLNAFK